MIPVTLALALLVPTAALAASDTDAGANGSGFARPFIAIAGQMHQKVELPEELKAKVEELHSKVESGEITREQMREKMKELLPEEYQHKGGKGWHGSKRMELPEELKAKVEELRNKVESGEITREQMREEMKQLMQEKLQQEQAQ